MVHSGYRWYLLAFDLDRDDWRTFRVDRIRGRVTEMMGTLTGRKSRKAKGRVSRLRGRARSGRGRAKRAAR